MENKIEEKNLLEGKNPVWEALKAEKPIEKIILSKTINQESVRGITGLAHTRNIKIEWAPKEKLDALSGTGRHQGVIAICGAHEYADLDEVLDAVRDKGLVPFIVLLDEIQDPHNLGAVIRTAECSGAQAVVITQHNSVGLTSAVGRASAGAIEHVPVCKALNMAATIEKLKERGLWIIGSDTEGTLAYDIDLKGPIALVIGSEDKGIRRLVLEKCDYVARLPMLGRLSSLNASVAAGVLMYETVRQRSGSS